MGYRGMKIQVEYAEVEETEIHIWCRENQKAEHTESYHSESEEEVRELLEYLENRKFRINGNLDGEIYPLNPKDIYYFEYVDAKVFAYTSDKVYRISISLDNLEKMLELQAFFRCSKAMIVNLKHIERFKSVMGNRIIATLENQEEVIISRHYAKLLRGYLKED